MKEAVGGFSGWRLVRGGATLTAWSTEGILGPVVVSYLHDKRLAEQVPVDQIYGPIFYILAGMLVLGWIANLLSGPSIQSGT